MAGKTKPARGWKRKGLAQAPETPYSDADIRRIAEALEITDPATISRLGNELQDHARFYLVAKHDFDDAPRPAKIRAALEELRRRAEDLRSTLQTLDDETRGKLSAVSGAAPGAFDKSHQQEPSVSGSRLDLMESHVDTLIQWTQTTLEALRQDKGGAPLHGARYLFVYGLARLYQEYTGKRPRRRHDPYADHEAEAEYGPFRDFVVAALEPLNPEAATKGLDSVIKATLQALPDMA